MTFGFVHETKAPAECIWALEMLRGWGIGASLHFVGASGEAGPPLRVVVGEDDVLLREGICRILADAGLEVVASSGDADDLLRRALAYRPDVVVADVQMPPRGEDDGLQAALELRRLVGREDRS